MKKLCITITIAAILVSSTLLYAQQKGSSEFLKEGLLGAGSGAVGGLVSGAKGKDVWKGALAGAGINIVGGALLDSISGERVTSVERVHRMDSQEAYGAGYQEGFNNGYKTGYTQGYKDGIKENLKDD